MNNFSKMAQVLTDALKLKTSPVAVCIMDEAPNDVPAHGGAVAAGCMFWEEGSQKAFNTTGKDHENCTVGMYTHHMPITTKTQEANLNDSLKVFGDLGYVRPEDLPLVPVLNREAKNVVYSPLGSAPATPDVVLLFVNFAQGLIVSEAAQQVEGSIAPALGRPACAVVPQAANTKLAALSLGCCGARAYLNVMTDDIALFPATSCRRTWIELRCWRRPTRSSPSSTGCASRTSPVERTRPYRSRWPASPRSCPTSQARQGSPVNQSPRRESCSPWTPRTNFSEDIRIVPCDASCDGHGLKLRLDLSGARRWLQRLVFTASQERSAWAAICWFRWPRPEKRPSPTKLITPEGLAW